MSVVQVGAELAARLDREVAQHGGRAVIHAGHYVLSSAGSQLIEQIEARGGMGEFSAFTRFSWRLGCRLVALAKERGQALQLMVLVNDWQFVQSPTEARRDSERTAAKMRDQYFAARRSLPDYHLRMLHEHGLTEADVLKATGDQWLFSESALRIALGRSVSKLFSEGRAESCGLTKHFQPSGDPVISICADIGTEMDLIFCGSTNCAGEVIELLRELNERGIGLLVNLYPRPCLAQVSTGTMLAGQLYGLRGMRIVNVAIPLGIDGESEGNVMEDLVF